MTVEMQMLVFTLILGIVQLLAAAQASTAQRGLKWNLSSRDGQVVPLTGMAGRLDRAFKNLQETLPFYIAAVLAVQVTGHHTSMTEIGAQLYFYGRAIYLPVYAAGIPILRTLIWGVAFIGLVMIVLSLLY